MTSSVAVRRLGQVVVDACLVALAYYLAFVLRFDSGIPERYQELLAVTIGFVVVLKVALFAAFGLYSKLWRFVDQADFESILKAVVVSSFVLIAGLFLLPFGVADPPRGVMALDFLITLALVGGARFLVRAVVERPMRQPLVQTADTEVLVVGAGNGGQQVALELRRNPELSSAVLGFVDDDPRKKGMLVAGHRVFGTTDELPRILDDTKPDEVVIAIPSAPGRAAPQGRDRLPRARHPRAHAAHGVRAALARLQPAAPGARGQGRGRAGPRAGAGRDRDRRRLPARPRGRGHRRRAAPSAPSCAARSRASSRAG